MQQAAPCLAFELARKRHRRGLTLMAKSLGAWLGELRYRRFPAREEPAWDLIGWTCRHRGLTHRIASVLLQTGGFSLESVKSALEAAKRVKAVKTVQVLKAWQAGLLWCRLVSGASGTAAMHPTLLR